MPEREVIAVRREVVSALDRTMSGAAPGDADDLHRLEVDARRLVLVPRDADHLPKWILVREQLARQRLVDDRDARRVRGFLFGNGEFAAAQHRQTERLEIVGADDHVARRSARHRRGCAAPIRSTGRPSWNSPNGTMDVIAAASMPGMFLTRSSTLRYNARVRALTKPHQSRIHAGEEDALAEARVRRSGVHRAAGEEPTRYEQRQ